MKKTGTKGMGWVVVVLALSAGSALAAKSKTVTKKEITGVVNLNTATAQQLDLLPGIGAKAAKRIIEHRSKTPFAKVDDLRKVKGFGAKKLEKLKPFLTTSGPTTVAVKKVKLDAPPEGSTAKAPSPPSAQGRRAAGR
jgi:competence protein ComEA